MQFPTVEIRGFESPLKYRQLTQTLNDCVVAGTATEVSVNQEYVVGDIVGGRWFIDTASGRRWRLVAPADAFAGLWEPVFDA